MKAQYLKCEGAADIVVASGRRTFGSEVLNLFYPMLFKTQETERCSGRMDLLFGRGIPGGDGELAKTAPVIFKIAPFKMKVAV